MGYSWLRCTILRSLIPSSAPPGARSSPRTDPAHDEGGLLGGGLGRLEDFGGEVALESDALADAGAVAHLQEGELALGAHVVEPALQADLLADVAFEVLDAYGRGKAFREDGFGVSWEAVSMGRLYLLA